MRAPQTDEQRKEAQAFYRSPRWRQFRAEFLAGVYSPDRTPQVFCSQCEREGFTKLADELDHKVPRLDAPERALPPGLRFDLIAANPPYVAGDDPHLLQGDLRYEPRLALTPEGDGLSAIRRISADARAHLQAGGWLLLEHGHDQGAAVRPILSRDAYANIETIPDMEDRDRVTLGRWQG